SATGPPIGLPWYATIKAPSRSDRLVPDLRPVVEPRQDFRIVELDLLRLARPRNELRDFRREVRFRICRLRGKDAGEELAFELGIGGEIEELVSPLRSPGVLDDRVAD